MLNNDGTEIDNPSASAAAISDVYFLMNGVYFTAVYEQTSGVEAAYIDEIKNATADGVFLEGVATVGDLFTEATAVIDGKAVTATDGDGAAIEDLGASTVPLTDATFTYNGVTFRILTYQKLNSKTAETGTTARTSVYKVDEAAFNEGVTDGRTMGGLEYGYSRITADVYGGYAISRGDTKYGSAGYYTLYSSGADRSAYESLTAVQNLYIPSYNEGTLHINICIGASNSTSGNYKTVNVYLFTNEAMYNQSAAPVKLLVSANSWNNIAITTYQHEAKLDVRLNGTDYSFELDGAFGDLSSTSKKYGWAFSRMYLPYHGYEMGLLNYESTLYAGQAGRGDGRYGCGCYNYGSGRRSGQRGVGRDPHFNRHDGGRAVGGISGRSAGLRQDLQPYRA